LTLTSFRVLRQTDLARFSIVRHDRPGVTVFDLDGGMSAEYALEKAVSELAGGMSHSWRVARSGHGPRPVFATRGFMSASVRETVALYDRELGSQRPFDTVILSTGYPAIPYLSQALGAPVLPLHFLASADSVAEIRGVLDGAKASGYSVYATYGHDPSVDHAVAWIKLLDLPVEYRDFLLRHKVKRVIISGSTGTEGGETKARKIYLMYPGTSPSDEKSLAEKIFDLQHQPALSDFVRITDWESGVAAPQMCAIAQSIEAQTSGATQAFGLTAVDLGDLYDLASTITVALMAKNRALYPDVATPASGIVLNPYLMAYPAQEFRAGYVPIIYFQVVPAQSTLADIGKVLAPALAKYFPERQLDRSRVWVNSSKNFGGRFFGEPYVAELHRLGFKTIRINDYDKDEQWAPADGQESISEKLAAEEADRTEPDRLTTWARKRAPLTLEEFREALSLHPRIGFASRPGC
jgi:hypothetical protein